MNAFVEQSQYCVLVVDDDDVDREKVVRLLKKTALPLLIYEGASASEAMVFLQECDFHCVILDYYLKDSIGAELINSIQCHHANPTPIIMVSGNSDEKIVADVIREGAFDYLPKRNLKQAQLQQVLEAGLLWAENERERRETHARFTQLAEGLPHLVWTGLPDGNCDFFNQRWHEYTGCTAEHLIGQGWLAQVHPEDQQRAQTAWQSAVDAQHEMFAQYRLKREDGEYHWFDVRAMPQFDDEGHLIRWLGSCTDVHDVEVMRRELQSSEQRFHAAFDYAPLGMIVLDEQGLIVQANAAFQQLLNYSNGDAAALVGQSLLQHIHSEDREQHSHQLQKLSKSDVPYVQYEIRYVAQGGSSVPAQLSVAQLQEAASGSCFLVQVADLSERKSYEHQLLQMAHYDPLTGLANRSKLMSDIDFLIRKHGRQGVPFAVFFCDLDHFKKVNDGLGHEAGDTLLKIVAKRLSSGLRAGDSVARLGGDEFVVILQDLAKYQSVITIAEKLIERIVKPIQLGVTQVHVGMSIGIALYPEDGLDAQTLLRNADSALYDAKQKGRAGYQFYRRELTEWMHQRLMLDSELRQAIEREEFELYLQPVVSLSTGRAMSAEALIRWRHPKRGLLLPDDFIGYAQESGLITTIDSWVIREAIRLAAQWHAAGFKLRVAVNITARQFQSKTLFQIVQDALQHYGLPAQYLVIEITEQMFLENTEENILQLSQLKALGVHISLDDFGVGYSSLSYIIRFAPHYLKIDRSFVACIGAGMEHDEMIRAIIGLSRIIPMQIVAEGVEIGKQHTFLRQLGCHFGQGFLYSTPNQQCDFMRYLSKKK